MASEATSATTAKKRTRLSPEARRDQLLDVAREMISTGGVAAFTMDGVASAAGVSTQLVYNYFSTRLVLLQELFAREFDSERTAMDERIEVVDTFEELVRVVVETNFHGRARGGVLHLLVREPDVAAVRADTARQSAQDVIVMLVESLASRYEVPTNVAARLLMMASGAADNAADNFGRSRISRTEAIDETIDFIMGGITRVLDRAQASAR